MPKTRGLVMPIFPNMYFGGLRGKNTDFTKLYLTIFDDKTIKYSAPKMFGSC